MTSYKARPWHGTIEDQSGEMSNQGETGSCSPRLFVQRTMQKPLALAEEFSRESSTTHSKESVLASFREPNTDLKMTVSAGKRSDHVWMQRAWRPPTEGHLTIVDQHGTTTREIDKVRWLMASGSWTECSMTARFVNEP